MKRLHLLLAMLVLAMASVHGQSLWINWTPSDWVSTADGLVLTTSEGITITVEKGTGYSKPEITASDNNALRAYGGNVITVTAPTAGMGFKRLDFLLSEVGLERRPDVTPSEGQIGTALWGTSDGSFTAVNWQGTPTQSVSFTVGTKATQGTLGAGFEGWFCVLQIYAEYAFSYTSNEQTLYYNLDKWNHTATVVAPTSWENYLSGAIRIPSSISCDGNSYSVTQIGYAAFANCEVTNVIIPTSVTSIENSAFAGCSRLTSIYIPESVTWLQGGIFAGCTSLLQIDIDERNPAYCRYEGVVYTKDMTRLVLAPGGITSCTVPEGVTTISNNAFYDCTSLTSVSLPSTLTTIGYNAFYNCGNLSSIEIPSSVTSIGSHAFNSCRSLTSIEIPEGVTTIEYGTFHNCTNLASISLPEGITSIGPWAFYNTPISHFTLPSSVTSIGEDAFYCCYNLQSIVIPAGVTEIGNGAFSYNYNLRTIVSMPTTPPTLGENVFEGVDVSQLTALVPSVGLESYNAAEGWSSLGARYSYAGDFCAQSADGQWLAYSVISEEDKTVRVTTSQIYSQYESITVPPTVSCNGEEYTVTEIGARAFRNYTNLTGFTLPNTITTIGMIAFSGTGITSFDIPESVREIKTQAFGYCEDLATVNIPEGVTTIRGTAFRECPALTTINLPASVTSFWNIADYMGFEGCTSLTAINVAEGNPVYCSVDGVLYNAAMDSLIVAPRAITSCNIPAGVTSVGTTAFYGCADLASVTIPESVTTIWNGAFWQCSSLTSIVLPASVSELKYHAFLDCTNLTTVTCHNPVPPTCVEGEGYVFDGVDLSQCTLIVLEGSKDAYSTAPVWCDFGNIQTVRFATTSGLTNPDGFYLYNVDADAFLARANEWKTRASVTYGTATEPLLVYFVSMPDGKYSLQPWYLRGENQSFDIDASGNIWVDGRERESFVGWKKWTVTMCDDGTFTIGNEDKPGCLAPLPQRFFNTRLYMSEDEDALCHWIAVPAAAYTAGIDSWTERNAIADANLRATKIRDWFYSTNVYTQEAYDEFVAAYPQIDEWAEACADGTTDAEMRAAISTAYTRIFGTGNQNVTDAARLMKSVWEGVGLNSWSTEGNTDGSDFRTPFAENWVPNPETLGAHRSRGTLTGLAPYAKYTFSALTRVRSAEEDVRPYGITLQVGDGDEVDVCTGTRVEGTDFYLGTVTAEGRADADGHLTIQYIMDEDNNVNWLCWKNMQYNIAPGDYYVQNVETGLFLNGANSWGTKASLCTYGQLVTLGRNDDGTYSIDTHIGNGNENRYLGTNGYMDAPQTGYFVTPEPDGTLSIWSDAEGKYYTAEEGLVNLSATEVTSAAKWQFVPREAIVARMEQASMANPMDVTSLIADPNFSRLNAYFDEKWEGDKPSKSGGEDNDAATGKLRVANIWGKNNGTFDSYQTLTDLPNGLYKLNVQGCYRYNNTTDDQFNNSIAQEAHTDGSEIIYSYFYANGVAKRLTSIADETAKARLKEELNRNDLPGSTTSASEAFQLGLYDNELTVVVTDGTLRIGVKKIGHIGCDWTVWDNFRLQYCGPVDDEDAMAEYHNVVKAADANANGSASIADVVRTIRDLKTAGESATVHEEEVERIANGVLKAKGGSDYVDLGLPSGTLWATCNLGATSPEQQGKYYAWGETRAYDTFSEQESAMGTMSTDNMQRFGIIDANQNLLPQYDTATQLKGNDWRMPTDAEAQELFDYCTWVQTTRNGVSGYEVTGRNGYSIFLPAGCNWYWTSTVYGTSSESSIFFALSGGPGFGYSRIYAMPIRPVKK